MRVLVAHNEYAAPSGEETAVDVLVETLRAHGLEVREFRRSSATIPHTPLGLAGAAIASIYSVEAARAFQAEVVTWRPEVVHLHNLYPLISPSVLRVCSRLDLPTVMTLHNYRLLCPTGLFFSKGEICERCARGNVLWAVWRDCADSLGKSVAYAARTAAGRVLGEFSRIRRFVCVTRFQRDKLISHGVTGDRLDVVPNPSRPLPASGAGEWSPESPVVLFAGRAAPGKGLDVYVAAASLCPEMTFNIAGAWAGRGNRTGRVARNVYYLGWLGGAELAKAMRASLTVVVPSTYYEGLPMVVLEAMGLGVPVVASGHGGLPEVVRDGFNGRLFRPGDAKDLGRTLRELRSAPESTRRLGETAIRDAQSEFSQARFFQRIVSVYERAIWGR